MNDRLLRFAITVLSELYASNLIIDQEFDTGAEDYEDAIARLEKSLQELSQITDLPVEDLRRRALR